MWNNELLTTVQTKYLEWLVHHLQMLHHFEPFLCDHVIGLGLTVGYLNIP